MSCNQSYTSDSSTAIIWVELFSIATWTIEAPMSAYPVLTRDALTRLLKQSKTEGLTSTLRSFRERL